MRKSNPQTHPACRSLLQKAVRRGDVALVRKIALHLHNVGDTDWLKTRTAIITFEECWPLGNNLQLATGLNDIIETLIRVTQSVKAKDAAGLGVLAYALSEGDSSMLSNIPEDQHIQNVYEAIKKQEDFWNWAIQQCSSDDEKQFIAFSLKAYRRGGWPWDRALIQAAAYLAVTKGIPQTLISKQLPLEVPFWVGLDKHTPQGKKAFINAAKNLGISARLLSWISFYLESARVNDITNSYWWSKEYQWRLGQLGLNYDKARIIWDKAQPVIIKILAEETKSLQVHLDDSSEQGNVIDKIFGQTRVQQEHLPGFS